MSAETRQRERVECRTPEGRLLATVDIFAPVGSESLGAGTHPLLLLPPEEARRHAEARLQLRERGRYEYCLKPVSGAPDDLALLPQRGVQPSTVESPGEDRGLIEPQDYCGLFPLTVIRRGDAAQSPLARGAVEVRSLKIGYRDHYRGMLSYIAEKCSGLLLDSRAPTKLRLDTLWRENSRIMEQQLEFLRHTLESSPFRAAVDQVLSNPHRRLEDKREERVRSVKALGAAYLADYKLRHKAATFAVYALGQLLGQCAHVVDGEGVADDGRRRVVVCRE